jgi:hypothetical protein
VQHLLVQDQRGQCQSVVVDVVRKGGTGCSMSVTAELPDMAGASTLDQGGQRRYSTAASRSLTSASSHAAASEGSCETIVFLVPFVNAVTASLSTDISVEVPADIAFNESAIL